jgi:hypothetical protein
MALFEVTSFTAFNWQLPMFYGPVSRLSSSSSSVAKIPITRKNLISQLKEKLEMQINGKVPKIA